MLMCAITAVYMCMLKAVTSEYNLIVSVSSKLWYVTHTHTWVHAFDKLKCSASIFGGLKLRQSRFSWHWEWKLSEKNTRRGCVGKLASIASNAIKHTRTTQLYICDMTCTLHSNGIKENLIFIRAFFGWLESVCVAGLTCGWTLHQFTPWDKMLMKWVN